MATFKEATGKTIDEAFAEFHESNPFVYELFCRYVNVILSKGKKITSSKMILNRIRWEIMYEREDGEDYKINDAFTSRYARLYLQQHPEHNDPEKRLFELRELRTN